MSENDPFEDQSLITFGVRETSPYVNRMRMDWARMREDVLSSFPSPPGLPSDIDSYLRRVDEVYVNDAYNSLSIEGYKVSAALIEKVRSGTWNPDKDDQDHRNALAARGYWQAFQAVKRSIEAVRELMPAFFDLLRQEQQCAVRVVLGHFMFVYVHPYMDGNGRMGRFLMNLMLASGGYSWTIVPLERRKNYMAALERASVGGNIKPFSKFLGDRVRNGAGPSG